MKWLLQCELHVHCASNEYVGIKKVIASQKINIELS